MTEVGSSGRFKRRQFRADPVGGCYSGPGRQLMSGASLWISFPASSFPNLYSSTSTTSNRPMSHPLNGWRWQDGVLARLSDYGSHNLSEERIGGRLSSGNVLI
jgi:hypothetical protein